MKKLSETLLYQDQWLKFYQDEVAFADGTKGTQTWVDRKPGAGVVVVTKDKTLLLSKEFRYVIQDYSWEIPGGGIDIGETPEAAAIRELQEETGLEIQESQLKKLGTFYPLNSFNTETVTVFMAVIEPADLGSVTTKGTEVAENIVEQRFFGFGEVLDMVDTGKIIDLTTASVVQIAIRKYLEL